MTEIVVINTQPIIEFSGDGIIASDPQGTTIMEVSDGLQLGVGVEEQILAVTDGRLTVEVPNQNYEVLTLGIQGTATVNYDAMLDDDQLIDFIDDDHWFEGYAVAGSLEADPVWKIRYVQVVSPEGDTVKKWANGSAARDKVWDARQTYTY